MRHTVSLLFFVCVGLCAIAALFNSVNAIVPPHYKEWSVIGAASQERISVHIALWQQNLDVLDKIHTEISDPHHPAYGTAYTADEILDIIAPPQEQLEEVLSWLSKLGPDATVVSYRDAVVVTAAASDVAALFSTKLVVYKHTSGVQTVRMAPLESYKLPAHISPIVELVVGLSDFPRLKKKSLRERALARGLKPKPTDDTYDYVVPAVINRLYNIPTDFLEGATASDDNIQVAMEFDPVGYPLDSDYEQFCQSNNIPYLNYSNVVGPVLYPGSEDTESTLDVQYLGGVGVNVSMWYWTISGGWAYEMALAVFNYPPPLPAVVSVSYGWPEVYTCQSAVTNANCTDTDSKGYVKRANTEFQKTGTVRVSFLIASQDEGAPSEANSYCQYDDSNDNQAVYGIYPCSSPYVTCVSGTTVGPEANDDVKQPQLPPLCFQDSQYACANSSVELPCESNNTEYEWTTGGGFSEYGERPSYQVDVVKAYLDTPNVIVPPDNKFPGKKNRGYPDVSAVGDRLLIISGGEIGVEAGTSASTPIFAGIVSLLNEWRLSHNKTALGFLNPLLYKMAQEKPETFKDITSGDNKCAEGICCKYGYGATVGWDAVTGLGTPNVKAMLEYIKKLDN